MPKFQPIDIFLISTIFLWNESDALWYTYTSLCKNFIY